MYTPKNRDKENMSREASAQVHSYTVAKTVRFCTGLFMVHVSADIFVKVIQVIVVTFKSLIVLDLVRGFFFF